MKYRSIVFVIAGMLSACGGSGVDQPQEPVTLPPPANAAPVANAGEDITINEQTSVTLSGTGTDNDGSIVSYLWQQTSGTNVTVTNADTSQARLITPDVVTNETLTFSLTVTDNDGATHTDDLSVKVLHVNILPTADAGSDTATFVNTETSLIGTGSDEDGFILSYQWQQISGTQVVLATPESKTTTFTTPVVGQDETLTFSLTVTDNHSATSTDTVHVTTKAVSKWQYDRTFILDLNQDDMLDLVNSYKSEYGVSKVSYRENLGDGSFSNEHIIDQAIKGDVAFIKAADMDNKFGKDLVIVTPVAILNYYRLNNNLLGSKVEITSDWNVLTRYDNSVPSQIILPDDAPARLRKAPVALNLTDISGDGVLDYVWQTYSVPDYSTDYVYIYQLIYRAINNGDGSVQQAEELARSVHVHASDTYNDLLLKRPIDFNGDGEPDIVFEDVKLGQFQQARPALRWITDTDSTYQELLLHTEFETSSWYPKFIHAVDWDEDGDVDIVTRLDTSNLPSTPSTIVNLFLNSGDAQLTYSQNLIELDILDADLIIDLDKDGKDDFIHYNVTKYLEAGEIIWQRKLISTVEQEQKLLDYKGEFHGAYDLNNDGYMDFVSQTENALHWYQNKGDLTFEEIEINITE